MSATERLRELEREMWRLERECDEARSEAAQPHLDSADAARAKVYADYQPRLADLRSKIAAIRADADAEAVAAARALAPLPEGTVVEEWEIVPFSGGKNRRTGKRGIVEIVKETMGDKSWLQIPAGTLMVRHLKKDGTPGKRFETFKAYAWLEVKG